MCVTYRFEYIKTYQKLLVFNQSSGRNEIALKVRQKTITERL